MKTIRLHTFETNSSSTHCMTLMTEDEFKKIDDKEYFLNFGNGKAVTMEEMFKDIVLGIKDHYYHGSKFKDVNLDTQEYRDLFKDIFDFVTGSDYRRWHEGSEYIEDTKPEIAKEFTAVQREFIDMCCSMLSDSCYYKMETFPQNDMVEEVLNYREEVGGLDIRVLGYYGRDC